MPMSVDNMDRISYWWESGYDDIMRKYGKKKAKEYQGDIFNGDGNYAFSKAAVVFLIEDEVIAVLQHWLAGRFQN